jgi:RNA polymerase sigma-70 factor (ECF subfamily)
MVEQPDETRRGDANASDEGLLSGFLSGDATMFSTLVHRYEKPLFSFICRLSGNEAEAADIFQETFVRAYRHANQFRSGSTFKTWLYAIATNTWRYRLRQHRAQPVVALDPDPQIADPAPEPAGRLQAQEIGTRIADAVKQLPVQQREVFVLRQYEEMGYQEIAAALGRPLSTVKSQMRLAVMKLRGDLRSIAKVYGLA